MYCKYDWLIILTTKKKKLEKEYKKQQEIFNRLADERLAQDIERARRNQELERINQDLALRVPIIDIYTNFTNPI